MLVKGDTYGLSLLHVIYWVFRVIKYLNTEVLNDYIFVSNKNRLPNTLDTMFTLTRHGRNGVPNHRQVDCLLNRLLRLATKKTSKLRIAGPLAKVQ